jgi:hypothetical protein
MQADAWHGHCSIRCRLRLVDSSSADRLRYPATSPPGIRLSQNREVDHGASNPQGADVASSPNPLNADPLDPSIEEAGGDMIDDLDTPIEEDAKGEIGGELRHRMISEAAYQFYAERGYVDRLVDDWLQAEAEVDRSLGGQHATH